MNPKCSVCGRDHYPQCPGSEVWAYLFGRLGPWQFFDFPRRPGHSGAGAPVVLDYPEAIDTTARTSSPPSSLPALAR